MTLSAAALHEEWFALAAALRELGRNRDAARACRQALRFDPRDAEAWHKLGVCHTALRERDEAIVAYRRALALDPLHERARLNLGTLLKTRSPREARLHLAVLWRHDPDMAALLALNLGVGGTP